MMRITVRRINQKINTMNEETTVISVFCTIFHFLISVNDGETLVFGALKLVKSQSRLANWAPQLISIIEVDNFQYNFPFQLHMTELIQIRKDRNIMIGTLSRIFRVQ